MSREPADLHDPALRDRAVRAARGEAPFDILITGATLADMATGELRATDIGLVGALVSSLHPPAAVPTRRRSAIAPAASWHLG